MVTIFDIPIKCTVKKDGEILEGYLVCADEKGFTVVDEKGETIGVYKKEEIEN